MEWNADSQRRSWGRTVLPSMAVLATGLIGVAIAGCTTTIVVPAPVGDSVEAYIIDYGRHSSLVLPKEGDSLVEYTYGEWEWFALNQTGIVDVLRALLVPSTGALGRREFELAHPDDAWWAEIAFDEIFAMRVEREAALTLIAALDAEWEEHADTAVYNELYNLFFVVVPQPYHLWNNCNPVLARWLEQLGCEIRGWALISEWRLVLPEE